MGQVGKSSPGCFGTHVKTHGCSLLSAKHLALLFIQMFWHHLGISINPKTKLIWLTKKKKNTEKQPLISQNSHGTLVYVSNGTHLSLSGSLIYYSFLYTNLPPPLDNGYLGERDIILFASISPIPCTGSGAQKVLNKHLQNECAFCSELIRRHDSEPHSTEGRDN